MIKKINNLKLKRNQSINEVIKKFPKLFKGIGNFESPLQIHLKEESVPYFQSIPRNIALPLLDSVKKELNRLLKLGIIVPVDFPNNWCSPIVVVQKENGSVRLCGDYTKLNNSFKRSNFPIPKVDVKE